MFHLMYIIGLERQLVNDISLNMYGGGGKETEFGISHYISLVGDGKRTD